jgi:peroxiredoxin Q/BCP
MVELRKRKAPAQPPTTEKKPRPAPKPAPKAKEPQPETEESPAPKVPETDDTIDLKTFGGEIETNEGVKTTLQKLVDESETGVVLFTYPKASTPGCKSLFLCLIHLESGTWHFGNSSS